MKSFCRFFHPKPCKRSLPARGARIEIPPFRCSNPLATSLPARGARIEIPAPKRNAAGSPSLPARGARIEMSKRTPKSRRTRSLPARGARIEYAPRRAALLGCQNGGYADPSFSSLSRSITAATTNYWYAGGMPVAGSEAECLELLRFAREAGLRLGVHYCSLDNKFTGQIYQQNKPFLTDPAFAARHAWLSLDPGDYFLKCAKVFGGDAEAVATVLGELAQAADTGRAAEGLRPKNPSGSCLASSGDELRLFRASSSDGLSRMRLRPFRSRACLPPCMGGRAAKANAAGQNRGKRERSRTGRRRCFCFSGSFRPLLSAFAKWPWKSIWNKGNRPHKPAPA